jgi:outer membrane receptor for ferrienterochelin and colicins
MKKLLLLLFLIGFCNISIAQKGSIKGVIMSDNQAVMYINIVLANTTANIKTDITTNTTALKSNLGTSTDSLGKFAIRNIPFGTYQLQISGLGYKTLKTNLKITDSKPITLNLELQADQNQLNEIVVTGTMKEIILSESPVPIQIFTPSFFKKNPTPSLFEALSNINGVRPQLNCAVCNTGDIHINGMEGAYTMVMIDGMPIVSSLSTVYGLSGIPNSLIERVEVVKGAASTLYGSEAVAGLINVITKNPQKAAKFSGDIFTTSQAETNIDLAAKAKIGKATGLFSVNGFYFDNIIDNNRDGFTDITLQKRISLFNKWQFTRKNNRLASVALRYFTENRWGGETNWTESYRGGNVIYGESIYTNRWEMIGNYQLPTSEKLTFSYSLNNHQQNSVYGETSYIADQTVAFGQLVWDKKLHKNHDFLLGLAMRYTYYDDNTPATMSSDNLKPINQPTKTYLPAIFVQDEITLHKNHKLLLGLRYDNNSNHGSILSPRLAYKWSWKDGSAWRLNIGNGFRVVNVFTEDHAALTGARKVEIVQNLKPEQSWNFNLGWQKYYYTSIGNLGFEANAFYTYFSNKIIADYTTDSRKIIYDNLQGYAISQGFAANIDFAFKIPLKIIAGFSVLDVFAMEDGVKIPQMKNSPFSATFTTSYTFEKQRLTIDWTGNCYSPMPLPIQENDFRLANSPWFTIQNIQISKKFYNGLELYGGVKNLFNFVPENPLMRSFDPFNKNITVNNPNNYSFDTSYNYASLQGIRGFLGIRWSF